MNDCLYKIIWNLVNFNTFFISSSRSSDHLSHTNKKRDTKQTITAPDTLSYLFASTHNRKTQNSPSSQTRTKSS